MERPSELPFTAGRPFQEAVPSPVSPTGSSNEENTSSSTSSSQSTPEPEPETKPTIYVSQIVTAVWLLVAAGILIWNLIAHLRLRRFLKRWADPVRDATILPLYNAMGDQLELDRRPRLMTCPRLAAPMLAGLLHPALAAASYPFTNMPPAKFAQKTLHNLLTSKLGNAILKIPSTLGDNK